ncbi:hypothetical protein HZ326_13672 [Fusarium oxysporum f. sp. albedinis]|nr:hypothetical protein HZ326_13672 [Fusarium oxysporum f. sp. albedinis]
MAFRPQAGELPNNAQPQWPNYSTAIEICWLKANLDWIYLCANLRRSTLDRCQERRGEDALRRAEADPASWVEEWMRVRM